MAKSPSKSRRLRRSRNVSSFLEESMENASPSKTTMNVVVDIHNDGKSLQRRDYDEIVTDLSDSKDARQSERSTSSSKDSSRRMNKVPNVASKNRFDEPRDRLMVNSSDFIEEVNAPKRKARTLEKCETDSFEVKPRRRKQWNTTNVTSEIEDSRKPPRKRWSKDTSVIRLPETSDASPLIDELRKPVPAPRSNVRQNSFFFDNPAFVSENEEVLRIETDHRQERTKIEMRKMSDRSNTEDVENVEEIETNSGSSQYSSKKSDRKTAVKNHERFVGSGIVSSKVRSSEGRKNGVGELNSSPSLGKLTDVLSSSITSEESPRSFLENEKKKKKKLEATQNQSLKKMQRPLFKKKDSHSDEISSSARDAKSIITDIGKDAKLKKKKKRKKRKQRKEEKTEMRYISVMIHRANLLEADYVNAKRPMVKVHIVETRTGDYLRNTENRENENTFLQPMITGKFDFKENRSMIPVWEEELIFEYDFDAITKREEESQVVILFEVIDLLSFAEASFSYDRFGSEGCWNKIAWAFLKPVGVNNTLHTDKKVRLQLYKPKRSFKKYGRHKCEVYTWWQSNNREKYPSSLFVTVASVPPPKHEPVLYRQLALNDLPDTRSDSHGPSTRTSDSISLPKWARLAAQSCKIPNEKMFETEASENGCFYVAFSSDGKYLACVHSEEYSYPIVVYEVETGKIHVRFLGHKTFVYSLNWSSDDHYLLSASADQTARIWDIHNQIMQHVEVLPHPSYVYCAKYGPGNATIVATGCYDRVTRIWANDKRSKKRELIQELEGHEGFVNSIVFQKNSNLITADSAGTIIVWAVSKNSRMPSKREWSVSRRIKVREIEGIVVNTIVLHPLESRLLVHSRNSGLRMLDLATGVILQKYNQLNNQRIQSKACISPCGNLILCGGEDSVLNVWNLETGKYIAKYTNERSYRAVTCVDYHPYDHILAFSTFGSSTPVQVLRFSKDANGSDVGLKIMSNELRSRDNELDRNISKFPPDTRRTVRYHTGMEETSFCARDMFLIPDKQKQTTYPNFAVRNLKRTNRLRHIIEKIDKMLFTMKLRQIQYPTDIDVESGRSRHTETNSASDREQKERMKTTFSIMNEHRSCPESFDLPFFSGANRFRTATWGRSASAKQLPTDKIIHREDRSKNLSDSAINSMRLRSHNDFVAVSSANTRGNNTVRPDIQDSSKSLAISIDTSGESRESSPDSVGTYVIDTTNLQENVDLDHRFTLQHVINNESERLTNFDVPETSDSSVSSGATFIINTNVPDIPKQR